MKISAFIVTAAVACGSVGLPVTAQAAGLAEGAVVSAARQGKAEVVERLLAGGVDPDARDAQGYTALMRASENGHYGTVQALLRHGASKDLRNDAGQSALDLATRQQHGDLIALLRDAS